MRTLFLILIVFTQKTSYCQSHFALQDFTSFIKDNHVVLQWTMKRGNTCFGTGILRSDDNIEFNEIGLITGICGSTEKPVTYTFIDSFPIKNRTSYYKLSLGLLGESPSIETIYYNLEKERYIVIPNPVGSSGGKIIFSNHINEFSKILLFDAKGSLMYTSPLFLENYFNITDTNFPDNQSGVYYFTIQNIKGEIFSNGSFVYNR